jgi:hypothetical protein
LGPASSISPTATCGVVPQLVGRREPTPSLTLQE